MSSATARITIPAFAKINLALSVGPPTPPRGYHPIASWFVPIDLHDDLTIERRREGEPSSYEICWADDAPRPTPIDWPIEKDLAVRAHRALESRAGRLLPVRVLLDKRTPVGGGLGGGSSDAAAVLLGVNHLFSLGLDDVALRSIAQDLGSDVAFFIDARRTADPSVAPPPALVTGFGDCIARVSAPPAGILLFFPPFGCPTGDVYRAFDATPAKGPEESRMSALIEASTSSNTIPTGSLFNDLANPACINQPELQRAIDDLGRALNTPIHVSGSGSTLFALLPPAMAERARKARPDIIALPASIIASR